MLGVNKSYQYFRDNIICYRHLITTSAIVLLLFSVLAFSGCVESADEEPDELPDLYDVNRSENDSSVPQEIGSNHVPVGELIISSSAFENGTFIPEKYTCDGENINPPLDIAGLSEDAGSLLLIMDDPDAPSGNFTHWVVWDIYQTIIAEDSIPGIEGVNDANMVSYIGPCPPSGTHRYFFKFYALDSELDIESGSGRTLVEDAMDGHVVAYGELIGLYSRS
ncbi:YbhB/YbcL family Raf kinase inhibitor-like protein [Methanolobus sp. ZRKC5]|uniref:YbhB/YbcL family Raf kinase inhibitor-like protein n=1 Tax=unclassified Methanolobus TaxID=2629569 RepID=UPI00313D035E